MLNKIDRDQKYMFKAIDLARQAAIVGEVPIAALLVDDQDDIIVAQAHNLCEARHDPTAHAEMLAIQAANDKLGNCRLTGLTLYVTIEPCPMCAGAIMLSRIKRVVYGALDNKSGGVHSLFNILTNPGLNHCVQVTGGVCEQECISLMQQFFIGRR